MKKENQQQAENFKQYKFSLRRHIYKDIWMCWCVCVCSKNIHFVSFSEILIYFKFKYFYFFFFRLPVPTMSILVPCVPEYMCCLTPPTCWGILLNEIPVFKGITNVNMLGKKKNRKKT